ncbi:MAG: glutathione S-transferase family protein [Pseudomonas sp.]
MQEYLEDRYPQPSLRPSEPLRLAQMRVAGRVVEQHVDTSLFVVVMLIAGKSSDQAALASAFNALQHALQLLTQVWQPGPYAFGSQPTLLDCQLLPVMTYLQLVGAASGRDLFAELPALAAYQDVLAEHPQLSAIAAELARAVLARLSAA